MIRSRRLRVDFSWENGFLEKQEYLTKRAQLQQEIESLRPIDYDTLTEATDLLSNFSRYWAGCAHTDYPDEARKQLIGKIVERVFVYDQHILALVLHGSFGIVLNQKSTTSIVFNSLNSSPKSGQRAKTQTNRIDFDDGRFL